MKNLTSHFLLFLSVLLFLVNLKGWSQRDNLPRSTMGLSDFVYTLQNDVQVSDRILEFDLYLQDADASDPFELAIIQAGVTVNPSIYNGGSISLSIVPGSSQLVPSQQPTSVVWSQTQNCIKLTPSSGPGAGNGTIISVTAPGTRICRLRITNTVPFTANSTANLTFSFTTVPYPTKVFQYIAGWNTQLTCNSLNTFSQLTNIVLNPTLPPNPFNVTGSGSYCQGNAGLEVGLDGSEIGVTYTLKKDGVPQTPTIAGTGNPLSFGLQSAGTYTVEGTNSTGTTPMNGSAIITETIPLLVSVIASPDQNNVCQGDLVTFTAIPTNGGSPSYQWYKNNLTVGSNQNTYSFIPDNGDEIYVVMTSSLTCVSNNPATSNTTTMVVNDPVPVSVTISAEPGTSVNTGTMVTFTAVPINGGTPSYQWYVNSSATGSNQNTFSYIPSNGDQVYVVMTSSLTCITGSPATSNILTMNVTTPPPANTTWNGGGKDQSWFNPANWNNGIPGSTTEVLIPGGLGNNYPTLLSAASCASITIENGASFMGSEFLTLTNGSALFKRDIINSAFHFISSPVNYTTFGSVFPLNQMEVWVREYNEPSGDWINKFISDPMAPGKGYSVQMTSPQTAIFSGSLISSTMTSTLSRLNPSGDNSRVGWNLIGNPYTSAIDWDLVDHSQTDASVYVWDGVQYVAWNGIIGGLDDGIIPAQNAFFVKTPVDGNTLTIPLTARLHDATNFYKNSLMIDQMLKLTVQGNNLSDQMFVHFNDLASVEFDEQYDAYKLFGLDGAPQIYSIMDQIILNINELPFNDANKTIPIGFKNSVDGNYTIIADGIDSFDESIPITLEDLKLGTLVDLRLNPIYLFNYSANEPEHRFNLHFDKYIGINDPIGPELIIYAIHKTLVVDNPSQISGQLWVYDLTGRNVFHTILDGKTQFRFNLYISSGSYIVIIAHDKGIVNKKLIIN